MQNGAVAFILAHELMMKTMPVLAQWSRITRGILPKLSVPWDIIAPHEARALLNHDQTLEQLARRGGLAAGEVLAILDDRPYKSIDADEAHAELTKRLNAKLN